MKKLLALLIAFSLIITSGAVCSFASEEAEPVLSYSFDGENTPELFGNAKTVFDIDKKGNVLSLDGSEGTYAEIPQGFFDGRNVLTITFDVLTKENDGNYFTFAFGKNNEVYDYFRIRGTQIRNAITLYSYPNEKETKYNRDNTNTWICVALVIESGSLKLYVDGELVSENNDTGIKVSDMGDNLVSYFGKSLYDGDNYFNGCFDNFEVYDTVLSDSKIKEIADTNLPIMPTLRYTFEDGAESSPSFFGNASTAYDSEKKSKVLYLDGENGSYAEIPQGFFDNKNKMTVMFDIKPAGSSGNFFTFTFGKDSTKYCFFRIRGTEIRSAITVDNYYNEREAKINVGFNTNVWMHIAIVFDGDVMKLYVNGKEAAKNENMGITVSDLGENLVSYLGKSMYDGDGYFKGSFDNFEVYDSVLPDELINYRAKSSLPLLISASVGRYVSDLDSVSGTDDHTAVKLEIDRSKSEVLSTVQRRQNIKSVPVTFHLLNSDCKLFVDGKELDGTIYLDMTYDRDIKIVYGDSSENYILKAAEIANNPILPGQYADPDIDILDGKFWIYPTTDGTPGWNGTEFHAFSSKDMVHWKDEGVILDVQNDSPSLNSNGVQIASSLWSDGSAWAPTIEEKDGKYYFYYCGNIKDEYTSLYGSGKAIGVAWANSPEGPYTALESPIAYPKMMENANIGYQGQVIDPSIFTDDDGTSYFLFGNGMAAMAKLNSNMTSIDTSSLRIINNLDGFRESVSVFKRNNYYYFHWSCDDTGSENYHIRYGIASSLTGDVTNKGVLLEKDVDAGILATGHQSIIYIPETDKCFIAYHRFYTPSGGAGHHRETCIDEVTFKSVSGGADTLNQVTPTMSGAGYRDIHGHSVRISTTLPTCDTDGSIVGICTNGETQFNITKADAPELKAAGHIYYHKNYPVSCTEGGYDEYYCTSCKLCYKENIENALGHDLSIDNDYASHFVISCSRGDLNKSFDFSDVAGAKEGSEEYDSDLDFNDDKIINGKDFGQLLKNTE